mgnify:CR=1 FL=1
MSIKILFGFHAVTVRLKTAPGSITDIHVDSARRDARMRQFVQRAQDAGAKVVDSDGDRLAAMAGGIRHQGVVARVSALPARHSLDDVLDDVEGAPLVLVLDGVTDPRNLGAVVRSVAAFGGHGVIVPERRAAGMTASAWKTSAGAASRVPVARVTNLTRGLEELKKAGCFVLGLDADGDVDLPALSMATDPIVLVIGSEGKGLSRLVRETCDVVVSIPMHAATESLNAGVAAGVALYEVARRRAER